MQAAAGSIDEAVAEEHKSNSFKLFEKKCCQAHKILRQNGDQLIMLFQIMLSAGMPELNHEDNIKKMVERLHLEMTDREASKHFKIQIWRAMNTFSRRIDNTFHNVKHKKEKKPEKKKKEEKKE